MVFCNLVIFVRDVWILIDVGFEIGLLMVVD